MGETDPSLIIERLPSQPEGRPEEAWSTATPLTHRNKQRDNHRDSQATQHEGPAAGGPRRGGEGSPPSSYFSSSSGMSDLPSTSALLVAGEETLCLDILYGYGCGIRCSRPAASGQRPPHRRHVLRQSEGRCLEYRIYEPKAEVIYVRV